MHSGRAGGSWTLLGRYQRVDLGTGRFKATLCNARKALHAGPLVLRVVRFWEIVLKVRKGLLRIADPLNWSSPSDSDA